MKIISKLFFIFLLVSALSCSADDAPQTEEPSANSCGLVVMNCEVPFADISNYPAVPQSELIIVGATSLDSIRNAIEKIDANHRSIFFPSGIYKIPVLRNTAGELTNRTILTFAYINNLEIYGEPGTVFQLDFDQETDADLANIIRKKQVALLTIFNSENMYIHDVTLKGNFEFTGKASDTINFYTEHRNILVRNSKSVYLYNLTSENAEGDAISITASVETNGTPDYTSDIYVTNVTMDNLNRNGISIAGGGIINNVFINKSSFGGKIRTQQLDFEPTANSSNDLNVSNVDIWDNTFNTLELSSNRYRQGAISILTQEGLGIECVSIRDNDIGNDIQMLRGASSITLKNNINIPSLVITNNANTIDVVDNVFNLSMTTERTSEREGAGILVANRNEIAPSKITFSNNTIKREISVAGNNVNKAFLIKNSNFITAASNSIDFSSSTQTLATTIGFSLNFEFGNNNETMNFTNFNNTFSGINNENEVDVSGQTEKILIYDNCQ